jgi:hypothetical protein
MKSETVISLVLALPIGVATGIYSGMIVSRYVRFADLRNQLLRIIRSIYFMQEQDHVDIKNDQDVSKIIFISSDLFFLQHQKAGYEVSTLLSEIDRTKILALTGKINVGAYESKHREWQSIANSLTPNRLVLFSFWSRL